MSHSAHTPNNGNHHPTPAHIGPEVYECSYHYHLPSMPTESMPDPKVVKAAKAAREERYRTRHKRFFIKWGTRIGGTILGWPLIQWLAMWFLIITGVVVCCIVIFPFI